MLLNALLVEEMVKITEKLEDRCIQLIFFLTDDTVVSQLSIVGRLHQVRKGFLPIEHSSDLLFLSVVFEHSADQERSLYFALQLTHSFFHCSFYLSLDIVKIQNGFIILFPQNHFSLLCVKIRVLPQPVSFTIIGFIDCEG